MPSETFDFLNDIDLAHRIATPDAGNCPYTLLIGAGASVSSGIRSANAMVKEWQKPLYKSIRKLRQIDEQEFENWKKTEYPDWRKKYSKDSNQSDYSLLFSYHYKQPQERRLYIDQLLEGKKPAFGYVYLASLIAAKRFNRILTVNFDDLLSEALIKYYNIKPIVCPFDSPISDLSVVKQKPKIVQLHGDFLYDDIRAYDDSRNPGRLQYAFRSFQENIEDKIKEMTKGYGLIVVGYSGNDKSIMSVIGDLLKEPEYLNYGLHWCLHKPRTEDKQVEIPAKLLNLQSAYPDKVHFYEIESFDRLMEEIHLECKGKLPKVLSDPHPHNLIVEFYESVRGGSSETLTDQMRQHLYNFVEAVERINTDEYSVIKAELKWELGASQRSQGNDEAAMQLFVDGYALLNQVLSKDILPMDLKIKALRRKSGLCIGIAKLNEKGFEIPASSEGENIVITDWKEALEEAFLVINQGFAISKTDEAEKIPVTYKRTFSFNGCCAYSLKAEWDAKYNGLSSPANIDEIAKKVIPFIHYIKSLDPEGEHLPKLMKDTDFRYLYEKSSIVKAEISNS
jgi:hypothetical protein